MSHIIDLTNAPTPPRWFEFLLEPGRLQQHLDSNSCDPTAIQLITLFFRNIPNLESNSLASSNQSSTSSGTGASSQTSICNSSTSQSTSQTGASVTDSSTSSTSNNSNPTNNGATNSAHNGSSSNSNNNNGNNIKSSSSNDQQNDKVLIDYSDSSEVTIPPDSYEAKYRLKKAYALQTLAITVASFLKWDINILCNNLTIPTQYKLMQALSKSCSSSECPQEVKEFSTVLYCHWFLRSAITYQISTLQPQTNNTTIIYLSQLQQQQQAADTSALSSMGELFAPDSPQLKTTAQLLRNYIWDITKSKDGSGKKAKGTYHPFKKAKLKRPLVGCFDSRGESLNDWTKCEPIEPFEFIEAACYDLGRFYFFEESYSKAKDAFEIIKNSSSRYPMLMEYLKSSSDLLEHLDPKSSKKKPSSTTDTNMATDEQVGDTDDIFCDKITREIRLKRKQTEKYLFECMMRYKERQQEKKKMDSEDSDMKDNDDNELSHGAGDVDLRFQQQNQQLQRLDNNPWYLQMPASQQQQQLLEATKGDMFMSQGNYKQAMGCFVSTLMLMTDYFRFFSKNYVDEEPYISRMIQCSISLSCFTQAVALCQMTRNMNYTIALKQLNERVCHDCCDDIYECIWNVTLLEYIINLHSKRGEVERRTKVIQLIGQLELNENNPEEILKEAEHVRRGRFFRILSNKYL